MASIFSGSLNNYGAAFNPSGSVSSFLPDLNSGFGSFGDYSGFGSSASSGGGGMLFAGLGTGLATAGLSAVGQGIFGLIGADRRRAAAKDAAREQRKNLDRSYENAFNAQIGADAFNFALEDLAVQRSLRYRNSEPYLRAEGRRVGSEIAGRFMDPTYAARTAQMFYG